MKSEPLESPDLLPACPWCSYLLRGLPVEHRCPECGQQVDRRWTVFGSPSNIAQRNRIRRPVTILVAILLGYFLLTTILATVIAQAWIMGFFYLAFVTPFIAVFMQRFRRRHLIAIGPNGLEFFEGKIERSKLDWRQVLAAEFSVSDWRLYIHRTDGAPMVIAFGTYLGGFMPDVDRFVRTVNEERLAFYAKVGEEPPATPPSHFSKPGEPASFRFPIS